MSELTELERAIDNVRRIRAIYLEASEKQLARLRYYSTPDYALNAAVEHKVCAGIEAAMVRVLLAMHEAKDSQQEPGKEMDHGMERSASEGG